MTGDEIRLHAVECGGDRPDLAVYDPLDEHIGTKVYSPTFFYVIEHPRGLVCFDSGPHPDLLRDARGRLGAMADAIEMELTEDDHLAAKLGLLGYGCEDVTAIVQSHLHYDHAGGLEACPGALVYVQRAELEFARNPPVYQRPMYVAADFAHDVDWVALDGDHDVFGDGTVQIVATPGHTPGHQSLLVHLQGQAVMLLADATYSLQKMRERRLPGILWSPDALIATWERIEALEARYGALLVPTHDLGYRERIRIAPDGFYV